MTVTRRKDAANRRTKMQTITSKQAFFLASGESRETSAELMKAILFVAGGDVEAAARIWEDGPSEAEGIAIWERVTGNGRRDAAEFCWGAAGSQWAREFGIEE